MAIFPIPAEALARAKADKKGTPAPEPTREQQVALLQQLQEALPPQATLPPVQRMPFGQRLGVAIGAGFNPQFAQNIAAPLVATQNPQLRAERGAELQREQAQAQFENIGAIGKVASEIRGQDISQRAVEVQEAQVAVQAASLAHDIDRFNMMVYQAKVAGRQFADVFFQETQALQELSQEADALFAVGMQHPEQFVQGLTIATKQARDRVLAKSTEFIESAQSGVFDQDQLLTMNGELEDAFGQYADLQQELSKRLDPRSQQGQFGNAPGDSIQKEIFETKTRLDSVNAYLGLAGRMKAQGIDLRAATRH
jgi:hypothetical protein